MAQGGNPRTGPHPIHLTPNVPQDTLQRGEQLPTSPLIQQLLPFLLLFPLPGAPGAPFFDGKYVSYFLSDFQAIGRAAGVQDQALPALIPRYCKPSVRDVIAHDPAFSGISWGLACERLKLYYSSSDTCHKVSLRQLSSFTLKSRRQGSVRNLRSLDRYFRGFTLRLGDMVNTGFVPQSQASLIFYSGLPRKLQRAIKLALARTVDGALTATNPPTIENIIRVVREHFDEDDKSISHSDSTEETSNLLSASEESDSGSRPESDEESRRRKKEENGKDGEMVTVP